MKDRTLFIKIFPSFLALSLIWSIFSPFPKAHASEVTGTLSSGGTPAATAHNGNLAGIVSSSSVQSGEGSTTTGQRENSKGSVLGASAGAKDSVSPSSNVGTLAGNTPVNNLAMGTGFPVYGLPYSQIPSQTASQNMVANAIFGIGFGAWIWILLIALILTVIISYTYDHARNDLRDNAYGHM